MRVWGLSVSMLTLGEIAEYPITEAEDQRCGTEIQSHE